MTDDDIAELERRHQLEHLHTRELELMEDRNSALDLCAKLRVERDAAIKERDEVPAGPFTRATFRQLARKLTDVECERDHAIGLGATLSRRVAELEQALNGLRMQHYDCPDTWYACPKAPDGCSDPGAGDECNCGADRHNAIIGAALDREAPR